MTLSHEYAHVRLHNGLWPAGATANRKCKREEMLASEPVDWMEWQAGYMGGALLMPQSRVPLLVRAYAKHKVTGSFAGDSRSLAPSTAPGSADTS